MQGIISKSMVCPAPLPLEGKSILVVEDEPFIAAYVEIFLLEAGAVTKIANSIGSAETALGKGITFDVAIVDFHLGETNAAPLLRTLTERSIAAVITTGDEVDAIQAALGNKTVSILQKPYSEKVLIDALMRCMAAAQFSSPNNFYL